ncbi:MAG: ABC transporter ATP-binding protein [Candidatus Methylacidiphilales bacterium]|nr:ABC transporter ATP-binding protein [Candidatus Methylacidiphilales bacterium]
MKSTFVPIPTASSDASVSKDAPSIESAASAPAILKHFRSDRPYRTLIHLYDGQWRNVGIAAFCFIFKQSPLWVMPIATAYVVDTITHVSPETPGKLWFIACIFGLVILQNIPMHTLYARYASRAVRAVQLRIRSALVERIQALSISYHNRVQSGTLHAKVMRDADNIEMLSRQMFDSGLGSVLMFVIALTVTLCTQPIIAMYFLVAVPISVYIMRSFGGKIKQRHRELRKEMEEVSARIAEMVRMVPITRAHGLERWEVDDVNRNLERIRQKGEHLDTTTQLFQCSSWVTFQVLQLSCLMFCAYMAFRGKITVGQAMMYHGYFGMLVGSIGQFLNFMPMFASGTESIRSIGEVLEAEDIEEHDSKIPVHAVKGGFSFRNVTFSYPGKEGSPALKDISLDIRAHECVAFVGESGSGKSTLMQMVIGFLQPNSGQVLLDGKDMSTLNLRQYRKHIAVVPQSPVLFSGTLRENIAYGLEDVTEAEIEEAIEAANLEDVVEGLPQGMDTEVGENGVQLSGGQRQRIAIARAVIRDPAVIVLDEATSALDVVTEKQVQEALERLMRGRTTLIVAHRMGTIRNADRIVVMADGEIVETGTHKELNDRRGYYHELHSLQT